MMTRTTQLLRARTRVGCTLLVMALTVLAGCAVGPRTAKPKAPSPISAPVAKGPTVTRLQDGREGFVISEPSRLDARARSDFQRAVGLLQSGEYNQAVGLLQHIIKQSPGGAAPYIDIAIAYEHLGKRDQAEKNLRIALHLVPAHPVASNEYALLLRKSGQFAAARAVYEKTLAAFPEYLPAHRNLGILCDLYLDDPACALAQYQIYSKAKPGDKQVRIWIAALRLRMGHRK